MFKKIGKQQKDLGFLDELEHLAQLDEYNETDFENIEIKKYQPYKTNTDKSSPSIFNRIEQFENRKIWKILDIKTLKAIDNEQLIQVVFDNLVDKTAPNYEDEFEIVQSFNIHKQVIYSIWIYSSEVNNGGLLQFYENSSGIFYKLAQESLKRIKANKHYDVLKSANKYTASFSFKCAKMRYNLGYSDKLKTLNRLDEEYFRVSKKENLEKLQIEYIREHLEHFVG